MESECAPEGSGKASKPSTGPGCLSQAWPCCRLPSPTVRSDWPATDPAVVADLASPGGRPPAPL
eukprot:6191779-Pleurochrysis_carterae.AAC.1